MCAVRRQGPLAAAARDTQRHGARRATRRALRRKLRARADHQVLARRLAAALVRPPTPVLPGKHGPTSTRGAARAPQPRALAQGNHQRHVRVAIAPDSRSLRRHGGRTRARTALPIRRPRQTPTRPRPRSCHDAAQSTLTTTLQPRSTPVSRRARLAGARPSAVRHATQQTANGLLGGQTARRATRSFSRSHGARDTRAVAAARVSARCAGPGLSRGVHASERPRGDAVSTHTLRDCVVAVALSRPASRAAGGGFGSSSRARPGAAQPGAHHVAPGGSGHGQQDRGTRCRPPCPCHAGHTAREPAARLRGASHTPTIKRAAGGLPSRTRRHAQLARKSTVTHMQACYGTVALHRACVCGQAQRGRRAQSGHTTRPTSPFVRNTKPVRGYVCTAAPLVHGPRRRVRHLFVRSCRSGAWSLHLSQVCCAASAASYSGALAHTSSQGRVAPRRAAPRVRQAARGRRRCNSAAEACVE